MSRSPSFFRSLSSSPSTTRFTPRHGLLASCLSQPPSPSPVRRLHDPSAKLAITSCVAASTPQAPQVLASSGSLSRVPPSSPASTDTPLFLDLSLLFSSLRRHHILPLSRTLSLDSSAGYFGQVVPTCPSSLQRKHSVQPPILWLGDLQIGQIG